MSFITRLAHVSASAQSWLLLLVIVSGDKESQQEGSVAVVGCWPAIADF
jgi:hypothetical protein